MRTLLATVMIVRMALASTTTSKTSGQRLIAMPADYEPPQWESGIVEYSRLPFEMKSALHVLALSKQSLVDNGFKIAFRHLPECLDSTAVDGVCDDFLKRLLKRIFPFTGAESAISQELSKRLECIGAFRIELKRQTNEWSSIRFRHDISFLALDRPVIAERCRPTPNTFTYASLHPAFAALAAIVVIEFCEHGKHSFHNSPRRTFIECFRGRTELCASSFQKTPNNNVVVLIASEAINLVDDEMLDAAFLLGAKSDCFRELCPVCRLC